MKHWYEELFENYANSYENESFTQGTQGEVDFIEKELNHNKTKTVLDVGCGTGRHAVELARRGYTVTGIDLSNDMLNKARAKAQEMSLTIDFLKKDARKFNFNGQFDMAIMLCEGAFPLMETDEMNFQILKNIYDSLKENGKLIFTTLNGLFQLFHTIPQVLKHDKSEKGEITFDFNTFREYSTYDLVDDSGHKKKLNCNERHYVPSEINWLLKSLGFKNIAICGCKLGAFSRKEELSYEHFEMLVIAEK